MLHTIACAFKWHSVHHPKTAEHLDDLVDSHIHDQGLGSKGRQDNSGRREALIAAVFRVH